MAERIFRLGLGKVSFKETKLENDWKDIKYNFEGESGVEYGNVNTPPPVSVIYPFSGPGYFYAEEETSRFISSWFGRFGLRRWFFDVNLYIGLLPQEEDHEPWLDPSVEIGIKVVRFVDRIYYPETIYTNVFKQGMISSNENTRITGPWYCNTSFVAVHKDLSPKESRFYSFVVFVRLEGDTSQQTKEVYVLDRGSYLATEALPLVTPDV